MFRKINLIIIFFTFACFSAASVPSVTVLEEMLHAQGNEISGKVSYKLDADFYDSALVKLEIVPVEGGSSISFRSVEGDIGIIHILSADAEREIWFIATGPFSDGQYIARVTVDVVETDIMQKARAMVEEASLSDMVQMFSGDGDFFQTPGLSAAGYKLANVRSQDGPHGVSKREGSATCFTTCGGLACTWDPDIALEQGRAMGEEFRAVSRNVQLGHAMNIVWHPQCGRSFEYYSEDSYLSGKIAAASARGAQERGTIACIKHYICNNMETDRENLSAQIDERSLRELFMPQFKECVIEGGALSVMSAFNAVNGNFCSGNKYLIDDVLRKEWGFIGYSMSDYKARITSVDESIQYGVDVLVPDRGEYTLSNFQSHDIKYAQMHAQNIIYANGKVGLLNSGYSHSAYSSQFKSQAHRDLVREIGSKALVLAKNEDNTLPIPKTGAKICLMGPEIDETRLGGGDTYTWESSLVNAFQRVSPKQGITEAVNSFGSGGTTIVTDEWEADYIIVAIGVHGEGEGKDRPDLYVEDESDVQNALSVSTAKTIVLFTGGSAALPGSWSDAHAIIICFGPGQEQGYSIADVLFGDVNPGGKLNVTFPSTSQQLVNFTASGGNLQYPPAHEAHGYFRVDSRGEEPLFAFGHGLSYTTFSYSNLSISPSSITKGDRVIVTVDVTNTGDVTGDEVVQLYLSLPQGSVQVRKQDLRGFDRITLSSGQTKNVTFKLTSKEMAYFKVGNQEFDGTGKWEILTGTYTVRVGTSSKITPQPDQPSVSGTFPVN